MRFISGKLFVPEAGDEMVVDHADGLHVGITDRRADKFEATLEQIFAHRVGDFRPRRKFLHAFPAIDDWFAVHELPEIFVESAEFFAHFQE
jgi:hypothetical protein